MGFGKCRTLVVGGYRLRERESDPSFGDGGERFRPRRRKTETSPRFEVWIGLREAERFSICWISVSEFGFGFGFGW